MKVLVFGSKGWIGSQFLKNTTHECIIATTRPENYNECFHEISTILPDCVISFIGRTHGIHNGEEISTIDYLEIPGKLTENIRDNLTAPLHLAEICDKLNIHYIYLGTGCIYTYTEDQKIFTEDDTPNFFGSQYSIVKGLTDKDLRRFPTTLQLRIRMPISKDPNPRNLIDKLVSYKKICSIPNSMTVLDSMWEIIDTVIMTRETGVINMTNPGVVEHSWILDKYKEYICPEHNYELVSYEEQLKYIKSGRSNNTLDTTRLENYCTKYSLPLPSIQKAIQYCIAKRIQTP